MAKQKKISKNYMDSLFIPGDNISFTEDEDGLVTLDVENKGMVNWVAQKFFKAPRVSHLALDVYGSALWKNLDGKNSVYDIINKMKERFPKEKDRMLDRVVTFLHTLQARYFIKEV